MVRRLFSFWTHLVSLMRFICLCFLSFHVLILAVYIFKNFIYFIWFQMDLKKVVNYLIHLISSIPLVLSQFLSNLLCPRLSSVSFSDRARFYCFWNESHLDVHIITTFVSSVFSILSFINSILPLSLHFYYYLLFKILDLNAEFVCPFLLFVFLFPFVSPLCLSLSSSHFLLAGLFWNVYCLYDITISCILPSQSQDDGITSLKKGISHILSCHNSHTHIIPYINKYTIK